MGRPLSPTGTKMDEYVLEAEMALGHAEKLALAPLVDRVIDPVEWVGAMGRVIIELRCARLAVGEIRSIVDDNKRRGRFKEIEL